MYMNMYRSQEMLPDCYLLNSNINVYFHLHCTCRYWTKWTCHCVSDPKDLIIARKKSTTSWCCIAGHMSHISGQDLLYWRKWWMRSVRSVLCPHYLFAMCMKLLEKVAHIRVQLHVWTPRYLSVWKHVCCTVGCISTCTKFMWMKPAMSHLYSWPFFCYLIYLCTRISPWLSVKLIKTVTGLEIGQKYIAGQFLIFWQLRANQFWPAIYSFELSKTGACCSCASSLSNWILCGAETDYSHLSSNNSMRNTHYP